MSDTEETPKEQPSAAGSDMTALVVLLGKIVSLVDLYGPGHNMACSAITDGFKALMNLLAERESIGINLLDKDLLVDSHLVEQKNPLITKLAERLRTLDIHGFSIKRGMAEDEFNRLIGLLAARGPASGEGDFAHSLAGDGFEHVSASRSVLRKVEEDEEVVKREEAEESGPAEYGEQEVKQIIAFLKGQAAASEQDALKDPDLVASNVEKLSELIMESVAIRQSAGNLGEGESMGDLLVGCLRRTFEGLSSGKSVRTQKGRKKIAKALVMLEKSILDRLRDFAGDASATAEDEITAAVEEMRDEVNVEGLAGDYLRRRKAAEATERKLLGLMKAKDPQWIEDVGLQETLIEGGLGSSGWQQLATQSGMAAGSGGAAQSAVGGDTVSMLALVLNELTSLMDEREAADSGEATDRRVRDVLEKVNSEVDAVVRRAGSRIDTLAEEVAASADDDEGDAEARAAGKKKTLAAVSEIVQELCQPLTVINCTIEMLNGDNFGQIPEAGKQPLSIAGECASRMRHLADRLVEVCGVPDTLAPVPIDELDS